MAVPEPADQGLHCSAAVIVAPSEPKSTFDDEPARAVQSASPERPSRRTVRRRDRGRDGVGGVIGSRPAGQYTPAVAAARLGVFGGTFDPPHVGHLVAAVNVADQLGLAEVLFVVANVPWQKVDSRDISSAADRYALVEAAVGDRKDLSASALEIQRGGDSVTADTLDELHTLYPGTELVVVVGSDAAAGLDTWRRADDLRTMARFAVVDRPGTCGARPPEGFDFDVVPCPLMDVSSTDIRARVRASLPIDYLTPDPVIDYITSRQLYR